MNGHVCSLEAGVLYRKGDSHMSTWLDNLSEKDLKAQLDPSIREILEGVDKAGSNIDHIGAALGCPIEHLGPEKERPPVADFWPKVKLEMYTLICTKDPKYNRLRKELSKRASVTSTVIVAAIAGAVSQILGFGVALLTPFVVLCLIALLRVGKEAWCRSLNESENSDAVS